MSSKLEIDVRVRTEEAAADVNKLKGDLTDVKNAGKTPVKIKVDTAEAQKRVTDIKTALKQLQLGSGAESALGGALGEISQEARSLTANMTGATKSIADMGISMGLAAANALGPWGQLVAGVAGAIGMVQRLEREQIAQMRTERQVQDLLLRTGVSYRTLTGQIEGATTAEQRRQAIVAAGRGLLEANVQLLNQGFNDTQIQNFTRQLDLLGSGMVRTAQGVRQNVSVNEVLGAIAAKNSGFFHQMGIEIQFTNNQQINAARVQAALTARLAGHNATVRDAARTAHEHAQAASRSFEIELQQNNARTLTNTQLRERAARGIQIQNELARSTAALTQAEDRNTESIQLASRARTELTSAERTAAQGRTTAPTAAAGAAAANRATAQQLREARRRIFDVVAETQFDERMRVLRAGTDERQRATQQFRNLIAEEQYRQQQSARAIQLARLEEDLQRTGRQRDENEAQRQERLANAQSRYNQIRRESLEAQDADATRRRELAEQEKTQAMETANAVRAAYDLQLQGSQQLIAAQEQQRVARQNLANSSLTQEQIERRAIQQGLDALPAIREQLSLVNQRIEAARERGAAESEINQLIIERMGLETQAMNVEAEAGRARQRQTASIDSYRKTMEEAAGSMTQALTGAATAAIFAGDNIGEALQAALASTLQQVATESAVKALFETAKGIAAVATGSPTAILHFAAAGKFAATAVAAGAVGAAIAPESGATASATGTPPAAPRGEAPTRRDESELSSPKIINISLNAFQDQPSAQAFIVRTLREAGYSGRDANIRR